MDKLQQTLGVKMKRSLLLWKAFVVSFFLLLSTAAVAFALTLDEAKSQGFLGEQPNGYLGLVVSSAPAETKNLLQEINQKRSEEYHRIAQKNGTSLQVVEALAGKKAIEKTSHGQYVKLPSGQWVKQ